MAETRPVIGITMGDASGIGPEIIVKSLTRDEVTRLCRPVVIGSGEVMTWAVSQFQTGTEIRIIESASEAAGNTGMVDVLDLHNLKLGDISIGSLCAESGRAAMEYIIESMRLAQEKAIAAIVTTPINKEATTLAGYHDLGHMELFARLTGIKQLATMLVASPLRVVHLTTHKSLQEACRLVTRELILDRLLLIDRCFRDWGMTHPRIGVAALNPHGGEGGILGREEIDEIIPAAEEARKQGIDARGPIPADVIFTQAIRDQLDVVLAMYHDQGHIPIKTFNFEKSVSVALGLPFIRTSVDHGTAFDIAGKGLANPVSLIEAIIIAVQLVTSRRI